MYIVSDCGYSLVPPYLCFETNEGKKLVVTALYILEVNLE